MSNLETVKVIESAVLAKPGEVFKWTIKTASHGYHSTWQPFQNHTSKFRGRWQKVHQEKFQLLSSKLFLKINKMHLNLILQKICLNTSHEAWGWWLTNPKLRVTENTACHMEGALCNFIPHQICLQHILLTALLPASQNANTKVISPSNSTDIWGI